MQDVVLRTVTQGDHDFLWTMLHASIYVPPGAPAVPRSILRDPAVARYLAEWGRPGDHALVATCEERPVGAAWYRLFPADEPGYGFVAEDVPELSIALAASARGQGIGTALLQALIAHARTEGYRALSLSVQAQNWATHLYERLGFTETSREGCACIMMLPLAR